MARTASRLLMLALTALCIATGSAGAQSPDEDPYLKSLKKALQELGSNRLQSQPDYRAAQSRWPQLAKEVEAALADQDRALEGTIDKLDAARKLYEARSKSPGRSIDHYLYGRLMGLDAQLETAFAEFRQALTLDRYNFWAWDGLGVYYVTKNDDTLAREAFERALALNKQFLKAEFGLVQLAVRSRNYQEAASRLNAILIKAGNDAAVRKRARLTLAQVYRQRGDHAEAITEIDKLLKQNSNSLQLHLMRAACNRSLERWSDAAKDYRNIVRIDSNDYRAHFNLAGCYANLGRNADAVAAYDDGLKAAGTRIDIDTRSKLADQRDELAKRPAREDVSKRELTFDRLIARIKSSPEVERRREAIYMLARMGWPIANETHARQVLVAFSKAVDDPDDIVAAKGLEQIAMRMPRNEKVFGLMEVVALDRSMGPKVRGMACYLLGEYGRTKAAVPVLLMAMRDEADTYVFGRIHESLNALTLGWIERVPPETLRLQDMSRIKGLWNSWYAKNRDTYRKYEPKEF